MKRTHVPASGFVWYNPNQIPSIAYQCGYCSREVASASGYFAHVPNTSMQQQAYICPHCTAPSFKDCNNNIFPGSPYGEVVTDLPEDVGALYAEARRDMITSSYTSAVMCCRKLLMHIAVEKAAKPGQTFAHYVDYLNEKGYVPPDGRDWVEHIRKGGNEANHEVKLMGREDAEDMITFTSLLLKVVYEFPARAKKRAAARASGPKITETKIS